MERTFEKPEKIKKLECALNQGKREALSEFWKEIEKEGTPLVEKFQGSKEYCLVTLIYREDKELENVIIIPPVGMRKLENCVLEKVLDTDIWYISYKVRSHISFTYQFSCNDPLNNDWNRRWKNVQGDKFNNKAIKYIDKSLNRERMVPYVELKNARKCKYINKREIIEKGIFKEHKIYSEILKEEREYTVYIPYGYNCNDKPYNMLVLNDGFEFKEILNVQNVLDNLIYDNKIPKTVAVLIKSTSDRGENLKCSYEFLEFIKSELIREVRKNYNVSYDPSKNVIGGYSLGGLFAAYAGLKCSNIFGNVLSQSGSYWYKPDDYKGIDLTWMSSEFKNVEKLPLKFYINVGAIEPEVSMKNTNIEFKNTLINMGYEVEFAEFGSGHDYLYWGETLADGLIYLIGKAEG